MQYKYILCIVFILGLLFPVFAQEDPAAIQQASNDGADLEASSVDASRNIMLARSSDNYLVTPGDVYTLAYSAGAIPVSYTITVDSSYRIRVSNLGIVNGAGKTFMQVKREVENIVINNIPLSGVQLVLTQPAIFNVFVKGEVYAAREVSAWGLSRLSSLTSGNLTPRASIRDIAIKSSNGQVRVYDLFKARRFGDLSQNPYLRPGDEITFNRIDRVVTINGAVERSGRYQILEGENLKNLIEVYANGFTPLVDKTRITLTRYIDSAEISGDIIYLSEKDLAEDYDLQHLDVISVPAITDSRPAVHVTHIERRITINGLVRRPGTYNLLPNENLKELIEAYGNGFSPLADTTRIELVRLVNSANIAGDKIFLTEDDFTNNFALEHFDVITVPSITQLRPVMFVEGAVADVRRALDDSEQLAAHQAEDLTLSRRLVVQFNRGETYAALVRRNVNWFTAVSDTQNAYVIRNNERIPININLALYDATYRGTVLVENEDVLVVPFRQHFVSVAGAVYRPGRYPYIPDRDWEYYIGLAGGFIPERNSRQAVTITDINGKRLKKTDAIDPESIITAKSNRGLYYFNQVAPIITTALSVVSTILTVIIITSQ